MATTAFPTMAAMGPRQPPPRFLRSPLLPGGQPGMPGPVAVPSLAGFAPKPPVNVPGGRGAAPASAGPTGSFMGTPPTAPPAPAGAPPAAPGSPYGSFLGTSAPTPAAGSGAPGLSGVGSYSDQVNGLISQGNAQGVFGPNFLRNLVRQAALRNADARRNHMAILGHVLGLDPGQFAAGMTEADTAASGDTANALNSAELQGAGGYQDFIRQLMNYQLQSQDRAHAQAVQNDQGTKGMFGQLIGSLLGGFIPGGGAKQGGNATAGGGGTAANTDHYA